MKIALLQGRVGVCATLHPGLAARVRGRVSLQGWRADLGRQPGPFKAIWIPAFRDSV